MERKKKPVTAKPEKVTANIAIQGTAAGRLMLQHRLNMQSYNGSRNINSALGYPEILEFRDYLSRYIRQDIAKAIINRPIKATWYGDLRVMESNDSEITKFETDFEELEKKYMLKNTFLRLDKLTALGRYGVLLFGLSDVKNINDYARPIAGKADLIFLKPLSEATAIIDTFDKNPVSPRYGLPEFYRISLGDELQSTTVKVHYSRLMHIVDELLESEVFGIPVLESVFNRLMDIEKVVGGSAEMFWRGARPGYVGSVNDDMSLTQEAKEDLTDQLMEYESELRRFLINKGINIKALEQQVADPSQQLDVQLTLISAITNIPKRILAGSERGELSSGQDSKEWTDYVNSRRLEHVEPHIIRPFIAKCSELGIINAPDKYDINWTDLYARSEKEQAEVGKIRVDTLAVFANSNASAFMSFEIFCDLFMGLKPEQVALLVADAEEQMQKEKPLSEGEQELFKQQTEDVNQTKNPLAQKREL